MSSNAIQFKSPDAEASLRRAEGLLNILLEVTPNHSTDTVNAVVELIFCAAVLESNANLRYVMNKTGK
jgi:hypothetical protein